MVMPNVNSNSRKSRLKRAKEVGYARGPSSESTCACITRLLAFAARTALVVFLIRSVVLQDFFFGGGSGSEDGGGSNATTKAPSTTISAANAATPKDATTPKSAASTAPPKQAAPPPPGNSAPKVQDPPPEGSIRTWEWKNSAGQDPLLFSQETQLPQYKHILLLGDSTMSHLAASTQYHWQTGFPRAAPAAKSWPCTVLEYCNMQRAAVWAPPDFTKGEGPATQKTPFCSQCTDCKSGKGDSGLGNPYAWEYINVDYARDVAHPSTNTKTTQETIEAYLKSRFSTARLCIINGGIQDMLIPGITKELYVKNLQDYLHKLVPHCHSMVWLAMGGTQIQPNTDANKPQSNAQIQAWNAATKEMMIKDTLLQPKVVYLDIWAASLQHQHADHILMTDSWYLALAKLWVQPILQLAKK